MSLKDEIAQLRARIARDERALRLLEEAAKELDAEHQGLQGSHSDVTISPMQAESAQSIGVRIAAGRADQSKSRKAQIAANLTDKEVAELTGYNRSTVCKWHNGSMKVPETAQKLLEEHGIPRKSWTKR